MLLTVGAFRVSGVVDLTVILLVVMLEIVAIASISGPWLGVITAVIALAAVRATTEAAVRQRGETLDVIKGVPMAGETIGGKIFDGRTEAALFPGELPADPQSVFRGDALATPASEADWRFAKFRPPVAALGSDGKPLPLPHIRLDRALEFLLGDRLA